MASLSVCMIVKNEAEHLNEFLTNHASLADEFIIVDTGSSDNTKKIASSFPKVKLVDFVWNDDFSAARNESIEHATKDWILILDPDERIAKEDFERLRQACETKKAKVFVLTQINYANSSNSTNPPNSPNSQEESLKNGQPILTPRLFKNHENIIFHFRAHESIEKSVNQQNLPVAFLNVLIHHYGFKENTKEQLEKKHAYYLGLIEMEMKEMPSEPKPWFEMGSHYLEQGKYQEAIQHFEATIDKGLSTSMVWDYLGHAYYNGKQDEKAFDCYKHAILMSDNPALGFFNLAMFYLKSQKEAFALRAFGESLKYDPNNLAAINNASFLLMRHGQFDKAEQLLKNGLQIAQGKQALPIATNLTMLYLQNRQFTEAQKILEPLIREHEDPQIYANLAQVYLHTGQQEKAKKLIEQAVKKDLRDPGKILQKLKEELL